MIQLDLETLAQQVSLQGAYGVIIFAALFEHYIYHRWEPLNVAINAFLLLLVPSMVSIPLISHTGILAGLASTFLIFFITLFLSIFLYRISPVHPLSRYPGPFFARISKAWLIYHVKKTEDWFFIKDLHERYGDVVRIGPNDISFRDPSVIAPLMGTQGLPKGPAWNGRGMHQDPPSLVGYRDPVAHAKRRRPWNRAFSTNGIKEFQPLIRKRVAQLVGYLSKKENTIDLAIWIRYYSYDFMGDMVFGGGTELMRDGDVDGALTLITQGVENMTLFGEMPWTSYYAKLIPFSSVKAKAMRNKSVARTAARYQQGSMSKDLLYYLSNEDGAEKVSPPPHIVLADGNLAIIAGSDTTAGILTKTFRTLLVYPEAYKKLQAEVDKYYPPGEDSTDSQHHKEMGYLEGVLNEVLRLNPVLASGSERAPWEGHGDRIAGQYYIPEGTNVRVHTWAVQRDPRYWSQPDTFWPERWMIAEGLLPAPEGFVHTPNAFIPFSFGPANCVGKKLAMLNMRTVMCHIMQNLEVSISDEISKDEWMHAVEGNMSRQIVLPNDATGLPKGKGRLAAAFYPPVQALIMHRDPVEHARRRRPWNRAFNSTAIKEYQPLIVKRVYQLVDGISADAAKKGVVDLSCWIRWFAYDFMGDMVFGGGSEMMQDSTKDNFWHVLKEGLDPTMLYEHLPWMPQLLKCIPGGGKTVRSMRAMGLNRAKARFENGSKSKDLFYYLSNEDGSEKIDPPKPVVVSDGFLAMIAGSDTTATVLSAALWLVIRHPEAYSNLKAEVDMFFPRGEDATNPESHAQMHYLEAVINEALRLYPAVLSGSPRAPIPGQGERVIGNYFIPDGTQVRIHFWSLQRDSRNFTRAEEFWPERWLIAEGILPVPEKMEFKHNPNAFIPFSFGPYNCVGKSVALQEMRAAICHILQKLELQFAEGWNSDEWERDLKDKFVADVGRIPVVVKARE